MKHRIKVLNFLFFFVARINNSNNIELASYVMHVFVTLSPCAYGLQETLVSLENTMKIHLDKTLYFFDDSPHSIFQLYFRCLLFYYPFYIVLTRCHKIGNVYTVFTQVSAQGAHLILSSQRGALIRGKCSFEGGTH